MAESDGSVTSPAEDPSTIRCEQCGQEVPARSYCVRCGDPLGPELRKGRSGRIRDGYAAAPEEKARAVRLVSTLYPALPREEIRTFQLALLLGTALIVVLGALGFFPVAIVAAAVLVPTITIIYLYDVDTYEDEPVKVVAATFLWGVVMGVLFAWLLDQALPVQAVSTIGGSAVGGGGGGAAIPWARGVLAPLIAGALMALGPMLLLGQKRFNDVLDGATFGVASAVAFVGAQTIVTSISLFQSGLHPTGDVVPWVVRLLGIGVALPVIAAGAIGGFVGVLWLRYRSPDGQRDMLGPLGHPLVAALLAAALLAGAGLTQALLGRADVLVQAIELIILAALAVAALLWLRRIIHVGLLQESLEIPIGPDITCANCGKQTPSHTFCAECGVSLRALPKGRAAKPAATSAAAPAAASTVVGDVASPTTEKPGTPPAVPVGTAGLATGVAGGSAVAAAAAPRPHHRSWLGSQKLLVLFALLLGAVTVVSLVVAYVITQGLDQPECPGGIAPCGAAAVAPFVASAARTDDMPFPPLATYHDDATGFSFEYDPDIWSVEQHDDGFVLMSAYNGALAYIAEAAPVGQLDMERLFEARKTLLSQNLLGFDEDREPARQLLGTAILGYRRGIGGLFGGAVDSPQGPSQDYKTAVVAGTDGQIVAVTTMIIPAEALKPGLAIGDIINSSFTWPSDPVVQ
ncbi:MAG: hypothetical protein U0869_18185 [Chloroflexota bacterium]